jgi:hypothetical protein
MPLTFHLPEFNLKKKIVLLGHFMLMTILSHQAHMIWSLTINRNLLRELGIIMNFNDHAVSWKTDTLPIKDRNTCTLSPVETLIEVYLRENEPQTLRNEYPRATSILDSEYKSASLDDVIKTCESLQLEEQHQLKILLQK